jgi:hypothetical protein
MEAYLINPARKAARKNRRKGAKRMAKKRQPAALRKYWAKKRAGKVTRKTRKSRKSRRVSRKSRRKSHRAKHLVKRHHRKGGRVGSYSRKGASVKRHWSNPMMGLGNLGQTTLDGLIAAGVLFGALFAVGYANGLVKRVPMLAAGWGELAGKLAIALGVVIASGYAVRRDLISREKALVIGVAGFAPLGLSLLGRFAPGVAGMVTLSEDGDDGMGARLGMTPGNRLSDYTIDAELAAELQGSSEGESEMSQY